ncbi:mechanosensitive ion channel [Corynebacterium pseudodiphtheriticum]|uniref:mechanosensitive ion channel family protein n=1 Tax=Corynebacterium pseudodiphtheriticum TaxID=37637 RepID=UPI00254AB66F|nr:mechanosensitive ion channel domain-containing protein [Corynebacterium pseudodiphtheriticum]MDK8614495.1 mechanosensitive ion channel [Corynebacterium pseudodiphtheriticum]MDK8738433.1 mechanosensitive ion channel [Corynebacterium pseudodiphtheriticum]MDK8744975.1 mechanosensitive ion channel [Corynebacterium pseudodiphtheriticum]
MNAPGEELIRTITWDGVFRGLITLLIGLTIAAVATAITRLYLRARGRVHSSRRVFGRLVFWIIAVLAFSAAMTVVFPSINPVDILGGIGVVSIAAGIAFQTVLGNMFAGIMILARDQFRVGDQVQVGDNAGTITYIYLSSTSIRRFDGQLVVIPNTLMHSGEVIVQTGFETIRARVVIDIATNADLAKAKNTAIAAMDSVECVLHDPAPTAYYLEVGTETVSLELLFWSGATRLESREATDAVIFAVLEAMRREEIPLATTGLEALRGHSAQQQQSQVSARSPENGNND